MKRRDPHAWNRVLKSLEHDMLAGVLRPGDHLPAERALAAKLGVHHHSVHEALRVLEVLGLINNENSATSGAVIVSSPAGGMSALMRLQVASHSIQVEDVVRTRLLLETSVVKELVAHSDTVDLTVVTQLLDAMEGPDLTRTEFLALDAQFHLALAEAANNQVITAVMTGLRQSIAQHALQGSLGMVSWASLIDRLRAEHRNMIMAIIHGDGELAAAHTHDHISRYYAEAHLVPYEEYNG